MSVSVGRGGFKSVGTAGCTEQPEEHSPRCEFICRPIVKLG